MENRRCINIQVLKYPGSKQNIASKIVQLIPSHHSYVEPYAGSLSVLFAKPPSNIETINDLDDDVTNLFTCIQQDPEKLARVVLTTPYSRDVYEKAYNPITPSDSFMKACNFLIRCWQGHGFRTNGYRVGWKNDVQGREKMYALWNWYRLPECIMNTAERLRRVQIENRPALEVIRRFDYENVFMYLDPPYLLSTRSAKQYRHEMTDADHEELLNVILHSKAKIMISGYESDLYNEMLSKWTKYHFSSCSEYGHKRTEVVWTNYQLYHQHTLDEFWGGSEEN